MKGKITNKKIYYTYYLFLFIAIGFFMPMIAVYFKEVLHFDNDQIGIIISAPQIVAIVIQPLWGVAADITKKTKTIVMITMVASIIANLFFLIEKNFTLTLVNYFVYILFQCGTMPLADALTVGYVDAHKTTTYGNIRSFGSFGFAVGSVIMGYLASITGIKSVFVFSSLSLVISLLLLVRIENIALTKSIHLLRDVGSLIRIPSYLVVLAFLFILWGTNISEITFAGLFFKERGISYEIYGVMNALRAAIEIPIMINTNKIIKKTGDKNVMLFAAILAAVRYGIMSMDVSNSVFIVSFIAQGAITGTIIPTAIHYLSKIIPKSILTTGLTIYVSVTMSLSRFAVTIFAGHYSHVAGYSKMFQLFGIINIVGLIFYGLLYVIDKKRIDAENCTRCKNEKLYEH